MSRALCLAALIASGPAFPAATAAPTPDEEALYRDRVALINGGRAADPTGIALYQPLERIPGAPSASPITARRPGRQVIAPSALAAAAEYAGRNNSSSLLVWHDGMLELATYFNGRTASDPVIARSLAKPVAAVAVGRAIDLQRIQSLDQPVGDFITEWRRSDRRQILVRHLIDMRAGFLAQGPTFDGASIWARAYLSPRHEQVMIDEYPLTHTPGTRYEYSNTPADLVAVLIERATGRRYAEFLSREIFQPLGAPGGQVWLNRPGGVAHAGCCLLAPLGKSEQVAPEGAPTGRSYLILASLYGTCLRTTGSYLLHFHLVRMGALVLGGGVVVAGIGGRYELDLVADALGHVLVLSKMRFAP